MKNLFISKFALVGLAILTTTILNAQSTTNYGTGSGTAGTNASYFGYNAGRVTTDQGVIQSNSTFIGALAGYSNTNGVYNMFIGSQAGYYNTTASDNIFIGIQAGYKNITGQRNLFCGNSTGHENTTGANNTFLGQYAGNSNTTASDNTFVGQNSGQSNRTGTQNVFLGSNSGQFGWTGTGNVFLGYNSGQSNDGGNQNVYIGTSAGSTNTSGSGNVFIGNNAGQNETGSNKLYIANSNTASPLVLGDFSNSLVVINGKQGIGIAAPTAKLHLAAGTATATSAPLKFTSGTLLTTAEAGAVEFSGDVFYGTITTGAARKTFAFLQSPAFTGTPTAPTAATGTNTTQLATTAFVATAITTAANLNLTGVISSVGNVTSIASQTGTGTTFAMSVNPTFTTQITTPLIIGGTTTTSPLKYKTTTGAGTTGADHIFLVGNNGATEAMRILNNGTVGIGTPLTNNTNGYKLAVNGIIGAKELIVENTSDAWPDYVFKEGYDLLTLAEVETLIKKNGHLPNVISAKEVAEHGLKVSEMNAKLLEKVEELTLYLIEQNKEMLAMKSRITELEKK